MSKGISAAEYRDTLKNKVKNVRDGVLNSAHSLHALNDITTACLHRKLPKSLTDFAKQEYEANEIHALWLMQDCLRYIDHAFKWVSYDTACEKSTGELMLCFYDVKQLPMLEQDLYMLRAKYVELRPYVPKDKQPPQKQYFYRRDNPWI